MNEKLTKSEMIRRLDRIQALNPGSTVQAVVAIAEQALEHVPADPKPERTPHWVQVRNHNDVPWDRRILDTKYSDCCVKHPYRCVEYAFADRYIAGQDYSTSDWRYMHEITERVPWTAEDYAKRQIVWLKSKETGLLRHILELDLGANTLIVSAEGMPEYSYETMAEKYTLPDGTELYKDSHVDDC